MHRTHNPSLGASQQKTWLTVVDGLNVGARRARRIPIAMIGLHRWMNCWLRR